MLKLLKEMMANNVCEKLNLSETSNYIGSYIFSKILELPEEEQMERFEKMSLFQLGDMKYAASIKYRSQRKLLKDFIEKMDALITQKLNDSPE